MKDKLTNCLLKIYPEEEKAFGDTSVWALCAHLTPHATQVTSNTKALNVDGADLLNRIGSYYFGQAVYDQAEHFFVMRSPYASSCLVLATRTQH